MGIFRDFGASLAALFVAGGALAGALAADAVAEALRDCPDCPDMVIVPAGSFHMGSDHGAMDERPVHPVTFRRAFALGRYEVTFRQWQACVRAGGCERRPRDFGWGRGERPVVDVDWHDAGRYAAWLAARTGKPYRLPSEAEWEYAARGGVRGDPGWNGTPALGRANCDGCGSRWDNVSTAPVGSFPANGFGLHDMLGNVWEWVADCWNRGYRGAPGDGGPWITGDCRQRVMRGGSFAVTPNVVRPSHRLENVPTVRLISVGFRVARDLE